MPVFPEPRAPIPVRCRSSGVVREALEGRADLEVPVGDPVVRVVPVARADVRVRRLVVLADLVVPVVVSVVVVLADRVGREAPVGLEVREALAGLEVRVVREAAAVVAVASGARVVAAMRPVRSASPVGVLRADASPSAPSARNSTTWKHPRSVACGCREERARPSGCHAVHR